MRFVEAGSQTEEAYSTIGRTKVLNAVALRSADFTRRLRLRKARTLFALLVVLLICCVHLRSEVIVTPRYFADSTVSRGLYVIQLIHTLNIASFPGDRWYLAFVCIQNHHPLISPVSNSVEILLEDFVHDVGCQWSCRKLHHLQIGEL